MDARDLNNELFSCNWKEIAEAAQESVSRHARHCEGPVPASVHESDLDAEFERFEDVACATPPKTWPWRIYKAAFQVEARRVNDDLIRQQAVK